jgi:hypothetical protein
VTHLFVCSMKRTLGPTSKFVWALAGLLILISETSAQGISKTTTWTANPSSVVQGKTSEVILSAPSPVCGAGAGQLNDASLGSGTVQPNIHVQAGFNVTAGKPQHTGSCELTISVVVANDAKTGPLRLTINDAAPAAAAPDLGYATMTVISSLAGPIPSDLAPQVDIDWSVLGYQQVYDNFGRRVASNYYAVQLTIGNNTGFPLQLSGAGFQIHPGAAPTPTTNKTIVQGTLIYGQDFSARNIIYRSIVWATMLASAASPYFHRANARANYAAGVALFSGAFVNGFIQQFPDNTVKQLARLGSSEIMSDQDVIPNNSQVPFIAFLSKESVCPPGAKNAALCGAANHWKRNVSYDPDKVVAALGEVTIVGKLLPNFSARIKVTATSAGTPPSTGTPNTSVLEGTATTVALESTGLTGAAVSSAPAGVSVTPTGTPTDSSFSVSILTTAKSAAPLQIVLKRKDGSLVTFPVTVQQPVPVVTLPAPLTSLPRGVATQVTIGWKAGGPDLSNAALVMLPADGIVAMGARTATSITATITTARGGTLPVQLNVSVGGIPIADLPPLTVAAQ